MSRIAVVGGGISGLATAYAIQQKARDLSKPVQLMIFEREDKLGGTIRSERLDGYLCESGPTGFLDNKPETPQLVHDLHLEQKLLASNDASRKRYLYVDGSLQKVPESPPAFLGSRILSARGKMRILGELWSKKAPAGVDETIAEFATRHIGQEAAEKLIDAVTTGIFAGDSRSLSVKSCFPVMLELEKEGGGSLIRAMIRRLRTKRRRQKSGGGRTGFGSEMGGGRLTSFSEGMETLIGGLRKALAASFELSAAVENIQKKDGSFQLFSSGSQAPVEADVVLVATPAHQAQNIFQEFDKDLATTVGGIPYAPITVVNFGYSRSSVAHDLDGFGFLIPQREKRHVLGTIWTTSVFEHMAPENHVALKTMLGGAANPHNALLDDDKTVQTVQRELKEVLGITTDPSFVKIYRYEQGIPQYVRGHSARLDMVNERLSEHPGLFLTGNAYLGIGVNDCTRNARLVSEQVVSYLKSTRK